MRTWWWSVVVLASSVAAADDGSVHLRRLTEEPRSDWLQLDTTLPDPETRDHRELSYKLGPFRIGASASIERIGSATHRTLGLFAYRTFHLSRWMHAWIALGVSLDRWDDATQPEPPQAVTVGLTLGTTFR